MTLIMEVSSPPTCVHRHFLLTLRRLSVNKTDDLIELLGKGQAYAGMT